MRNSFSLSLIIFIESKVKMSKLLPVHSPFLEPISIVFLIFLLKNVDAVLILQ